ncbi:hypothetical protein COT29_01505 [Candidatus Micrarchaeota archaeon CG08_land_8_20_14_0_20_59_11]|nr:MAG: hypothetical protein COT29_01505 [Candidatus Micrarchaeota archaeon CG08_land_8_20_14_0_20_59_11]
MRVGIKITTLKKRLKGLDLGDRMNTYEKFGFLNERRSKGLVYLAEKKELEHNLPNSSAYYRPNHRLLTQCN